MPVYNNTIDKFLRFLAETFIEADLTRADGTPLTYDFFAF